jgi:transcriptional regulator with XRE-family HTH domain
LRQGMGLSQEAFADIAGIHCTYVSNIGKRRRSPALRGSDKM